MTSAAPFAAMIQSTPVAHWSSPHLASRASGGGRVTEGAELIVVPLMSEATDGH